MNRNIFTIKDDFINLFHYISEKPCQDAFLSIFILIAIVFIGLYTFCFIRYYFEPLEKRILTKLNFVISSLLLALFVVSLWIPASTYLCKIPPPPPPLVLECPISVATEKQIMDFQKEFQYLKKRMDSGDVKAVETWHSLSRAVNARLAIDIPSENGPTNKTNALKCLIEMEKEGDFEAGKAKAAFISNNAAKDQQYIAWVVDWVNYPQTKQPDDFALWRENLYARANATQDVDALNKLSYLEYNKLGLAFNPFNSANGASQ